MDIHRFKYGYCIRLSETEFEALRTLVGLGQSDLEGSLTLPVKVSEEVEQALTEGRLSGQNPLRVDRDMRKK